MKRKIAASIVSALAVSALVIYSVESDARAGAIIGGFLAGTALAFGFLVFKNSLILFMEVAALALIAYFAWRWDVIEIAVSGPVGAVIGCLLVWGWINQHRSYSHQQFVDGINAGRVGAEKGAE